MYCDLIESARIAEPVLSCDARDALVRVLNGPEVGIANARLGWNARYWPCRSVQFEADPRLSLVAARGDQEQEPLDVRELTDDLANAATLSACVQAWNKRPLYRCATAAQTGLPEACLSSFVIDHAQNERNWPAIAAEAARVLGPGSPLILIDYGRPRVSDDDLDEALYEYFSEWTLDYPRRAADLGAAGLQLELHFGELGRRHDFSASCQANLRELFNHIELSPATEARAEIDLSGRGVSTPAAERAAFAAGLIEKEWGDRDMPGDFWFNVTITLATAPGDAGQLTQPWRFPSGSR